MENPKIQGKQEQLQSSRPENNLLMTVVQELKTKYDCQKLLQEAAKKFQIKQYNILSLSIEKVLEIYQVLANKFYSEQIHSEFNDQWYDNELRLFIWLFVCYCHVYKKNPDDITKKQWSEFSQVFKGKQPYLFEYQAKIIRNLNKKTKKWTGQEDQFLNYIIKDFNTLLESIQHCKWSEVAKKLFIQSNKKYFRTPKQCRQRWMNHLDPLKLKSKWTPSQDLCLMSLVLKEGKKWAMIAKKMGNIRTEHMVKNRYNSLLRAQMKKHDDTTEEMRVIKKMHSRIKYNLEAKNNSKIGSELKAKVEIEGKAQEQEQEEQEPIMQSEEVDGFNKLLMVEPQDQIDEVFDEILNQLKKEEPYRGGDEMREWEAVEQDEDNALSIGFEFKPTFLDYI